MSRYSVNATISMAASVSVIADSPDDALEIAREMSASSFDYDTGSAEVEFDVEPAVEVL